MILSCNGIKKAFGTDEIFSDVSFHINEREKAAIVGNNGAGKSTLLKIIIGELSANEGEVVRAKDTTIGYLAQHQELSSNRTIYEEMLEVKKEVLALQEQIRQLEFRGFQHVGQWTKEQATKMIARIADNHWRTPFDIDPATYTPR